VSRVPYLICLFWSAVSHQLKQAPGAMVKVSVPEMNWHGREAVYSVHFHPDGLLATGGMEPDGCGGIKLWKLARDVAADVQPEYATSPPLGAARLTVAQVLDRPRSSRETRELRAIFPRRYHARVCLCRRNHHHLEV
jgi:hypothetical protein